MQPNSSGDVNEIVWSCKRHSFRQCLSWTSVTDGCCKGCVLCTSAVRQMTDSALTWAWEKQSESLLGQMNKWISPVSPSQCKSSCQFPAGDSAPTLMGKPYYPTAACSLTLLGTGSCFPPHFLFSNACHLYGFGVCCRVNTILAGARLGHGAVCRSQRSDVALWIKHDSSWGISFCPLNLPPHLLPHCI